MTTAEDTTNELQAERGFRASLRNAKEFQENVVAFSRRRSWVEGTYRELVRFDLFGAHYLVNDPLEVGRILTSNPDDHALTKDGLRFFEVMSRLLGQGLFTSDGAHHLRQRRTLQPSFNRSSVAQATTGMVRAATLLRDSWAARAGEWVDVEEDTQRLSNDIAAQVLLGSDMSSEAHEFGALADEEERALWMLMTAPFVLPAWVPVPANRRLNAVVRQIRELVSRIVEKRRASITAGSAPAAILTALITKETASPSMSETQLLDEVATLIVGGYKTLAVAHAWAFYALATEPRVVARLREELRSVLGTRPPTAEDLPNLEYTRMVVHEVLRLYPPVWGIFRIATRDLDVAGARIPRGSTLFVSPYTLHRHPKYWANPETFDPEHFRQVGERPKTAWLPFGAGRHLCIGNHYSVTALMLSLATLVPSLDFEPPEAPIQVTTRAFTIPQGGMRLRIQGLEPGVGGDP